MLERPSRFVVIEGIDKAQSLIEKLLRFEIVSGNRVMKVSETGHQRDRMSLRRVGSVILRDGTRTQQNTAQHIRQNSHLVIPPACDFDVRAPNQPEPAAERHLLQVRPAYAKFGPLPSLRYARVTHAKAPR